MLRENRQRLETLYQSTNGSWLGTIAGAARRELVAACQTEMATYLPTLPRNPATSEVSLPPILLSGHQPQWFHPGVWFKNALQAKFAAGLNCLPVHFALDSDTLGRAEVATFQGTPQAPSLTTIPFDQATANQAIEDRLVVDIGTVDTFAERLAQTIAAFVPNPLIRDWGRFFAKRVRATGRPGWAVAETRHAIEVAAGWGNLETRMSSICHQPSFGRFVGWFIEWAGEFATHHNQALANYRSVHGIRNRAQPWPDLASGDGLVELPFWIWTRDNPQRKRLFLENRPGQRRLTDRNGIELPLPPNPADESDWFPATASDIRIRPRALGTTLYARLVLSDLFIHGIGGAKYDQLTDEIVRTWLRCEPPRFVTATATVWLPAERPDAEKAAVYRAKAMLRRLAYNPELAAAIPLDEPSAELRAAIESKQSLLTSRPLDPPRKSWHDAVIQANETIRRLARSQLETLESKLADDIAEGNRGMLLRNRELPFCLYPADDFPRSLLDLTAERA